MHRESYPRALKITAGVLLAGGLAINSFQTETGHWNYVAECPVGMKLSVDASHSAVPIDTVGNIDLICASDTATTYPTNLRLASAAPTIGPIVVKAGDATSAITITYRDEHGLLNHGWDSVATTDESATLRSTEEPCITLVSDEGLSPIHYFEITNISITQG